MILTDLQNQIKLIRQGNTDSDSNFETLIMNWGNRTLQEIWMGKGLLISPNWWWLSKTYSFPTVADQMTYDLPTFIDAMKVQVVKELDDDTKLTYVDQRQFDKLVPDPSGQATGIPYAYTIWSRDTTTYKPYIRLYPIPDAAYTIYMRFYGNLTMYAAATPTAVNEVPTKYDVVVLDGVLEKFFQQYPQYGDTNSKKADFLAGVNRMNDENGVPDEELVAESHGNRVVLRPTFQSGVGT
jgi:hypothetical protein